MEKVIGLFLTVFGLYCLFGAMNEDASHVNFIYAILFGVCCVLGAQHAKGNLFKVYKYSILWVVTIIDRIKQKLIFWRV